MAQDDFLIRAVSLFGDDWVYELSRRLSVNPRTVRRWGSGKRDIPEAVFILLSFIEGAKNEQ